MNVKRFLAMFLAIVMVIGMLPTTAFAAEYSDAAAGAAATGVTATKTVSGPDADGNYTITLSVTGTSEDVTETQKLPADIVLVVDTSTSMYERVTSTTNRLDVAKAAAKQFVTGLLANDGVAIGLYDFSGSNRTNVALTSNATALTTAIEDLSMPRWGDGTNYTLGLNGAKNILSSSTKTQKFVVFISDGEPNGGDGTSVARELIDAGVTVITVGVDIGSSTKAQNALKAISSSDSSGKKLYYEASTSGDSTNALDAILGEIQKLIENTIHAGTNAVMTDLINTDDFTLVAGSADEGLTVSEDGETLTWDIGNITKETETVTFKVTPNEGSFGTLHTNADVTLTFESTALNEEVTYGKDAIGDPTVYIAPPAITVTADSDTKVYDGTALTDSGYTTSGVPYGYTVTAVVTGSQTNVGSTENVVSSVTVTKANGTDVTELFANYITKVPGTLTVTKRNVTLTSEGAAQMYNGKALTRPTVTVGGEGWADGEGATATATGSQTVPGSCTNTIVYTLNSNTAAGNYNITLDEGTLTVTNRGEEAYEITVKANSGEYTYDGTEKSVSGFDTLTFVLEGNTYTVEGLSASVSGTNAGEYTNAITGTPVVKDAAGNDVTAQFIVKTVDGELVIHKRQVTLTSATDSKQYDGTPLTNGTVTVSGDKWAEGEGATYNVTGSQLTVGNSNNTFTHELNENTKADNYDITCVEGVLTVIDREAKYEITLQANSDEFLYDGSEKSVSGFETLEFEIEVNGEKVKYTVSGVEAEISATDAGTYTTAITDEHVVTDAQGNDVTSQFAVKIQTGTLTINKRQVTLTSATDSKEYDGDALTNSNVAVSGDGWADGEGATYDVTGSQTLVGSSENVFTYTLNEGTKADNYDISTVNGTLTVTNRNAKYQITVEANSDEYKYDGTEKTVEGFKTLTFEVEGNTYTVSGLTAATTETDAGTYAVNVVGTPVVKDVNGNTVTEQFAVSTENGTLVINKRNVTLTSATDSKQYDGNVLTNDEVTVSDDGFVEGEGATYNVTGSQLLVGSSDNAFTYTLNEGTKAGNYEITKKLGTLTVTDREAKYEITVIANSADYPYDGAEKTVSDFQTLSFTTVDGNTYTVEGLSASVSGTDAGTYTSEVKGNAVVKDAAGNDVTAQFIVKTVDGELVIHKRQVTLTSATDSKQYDGTPLTNGTVTVSGDKWAEGEGATYNVTGSQLTVGNSNNTFTHELNENTKADNYDITCVEGVLTVIDREAKYEITLQANSDEFLYDGSEKSVSGFETLEFEIEVNGEKVKYTVSGVEAEISATDAGTYTTAITDEHVVTDAQGNDVTSQFAVKIQTGTLNINKRQVTLTSATDSKEYDGDALTNSEVTVTGDGWAADEGAAYDVTGSQTLVGASENYFTYTLNANTKAGNYVISTVNGTLTVVSRGALYQITVVANNGEYMYDGTEKTVEGFETLTFEVDGNTYTVEGLVAKNSGTDAGTYPVNVLGTPVVKDANGNDVSAQFAVFTKKGNLVITQRAVTMTSATDEKQYDGNVLTNDEITVTGDGFVDGEGAAYNVTGSQLLVGTSDNVFTYTLNEGTKAGNYVITVEYGTLTVKDRTAKYEITVEANSAEYLYDGEEKNVEGFKTLTFTTQDGNDYTVEGLSASVSATDAGTYTSEVKGTAVVKDAAGNDVTAQFIVKTVNGTLTINKREVTLTSATDSKQYDGTPLTNDTVTVTGDGFAKGEGAAYDVTGSQLTVGSSANEFTYTLNEGTKAENYTITVVPGTLTVINRDAKYQITVVANSDTVMYDGEEHGVSDFETLEFTVNGQIYTVSGLTAEAKGTDAGTYTANVIGTAVVKDAKGNDVTEQFAVMTTAGTLTITKREVTMTSGTSTREYNGNALTNDEVTVTGDGFVEGEGAVYTVTGSQTLVGSSENYFSYALTENTKAGNYVITTVNGTLTVIDRAAKYEITVEANSAEHLYDGEEKSVAGFKTLTFTTDDDNTYTVEGLSASVSATDAGTYTSEVKGTAEVKDAAGNDVTAQFIVKTVDGTLTINKREVTLTSATDTKQYDGTPLTNSEVTVSGDGFAKGEGAAYDVTGSQLTVGSSANEFTYTLNEGTKAENYTITVVPGTLTVINRDAKYQITVVANSGTVLYDGQEHSVSGFETLEFTANGQQYTVSGLTAEAKGTDAGTYTANVIGTAVVKDAKGNDVTEQFAVTTTAGTLTITKRAVTLTSGTSTREYNGNALTNSNVTVSGDGWAEGEGAVYTVTGSQTLVGSSENYFTYALNTNTKADNYVITTINGTLTVTSRDAKYQITVVANNGEFMYDGTEKTVEGFKSLTFEVEGNTYTVSGLSAETKATDVGEYPVNIVGTPVVKDAAGNDVTGEFAVTTVNGKLVITKRAVTLTSATAMKQYDGNVLTNSDVTVSGDGFVEGEGATYNVTGSQLLVGSSDNAFTYTLNEGTKAGNYDITVVFGTLTVIDREDKYELTVEANSGEYLYDGTAKTVSGFKNLTFVVEGNTYTVEGLTAEATQTNAGTYAVAVTGSAVVKDVAGNDVTAQFEVTTVGGTLVINRATATVTVDANQQKSFGEADPVLSATVTGLVEGDSASLISYTLTRESGENVGNYTITATGDAVQGNYNVVYVNGVFRITSGALTLNNEDHMCYMQGYPDGTFMPEKNMTRSEVAVMFCRLLNNSMSIETDAESIFTDVNEGDWYYEEVCFMAEHGILKGYPDGTFRPWDPITRAEFATICTRFDVARQSEGAVLAEGFPDVTTRDWFYNYVMTAAGNGWVGGFPDGNFKPNDYITRSQVVTVVNRVLERVADEAYIDNAVASGAVDFRTYIDVEDNWAYYNIYEASVAHDYTKDAEGTETWKRHWLNLYTVCFHISGTDPDVAAGFDAVYKVGATAYLPTAEDVEDLHNATFLGWSLTENGTTPLEKYIVDADDSYVSRNGVDHHIIHLYAVWG